MPLVDRSELRKLSRSELKEKKSDVQNEINRLIEASEAAQDERDALKERLRKGDSSAEAQLEAQQETCKKLRRKLGDARTKRDAVSDVLRQKPDLTDEDRGSDRRKEYGV